MGSSCEVNEIPEGFYSMRIGIEVRKLHVRSCVHHFKLFLVMKFMERSG